jgi:predicted amidohydrolase
MSAQIRVAQIKIIPEKGNLAANTEQLMAVLREIEAHDADVVITPECFLDGYICTETWVTPDNLVRYAIDPADNRFVREIAAWTRRASAWFVLGCSRLAQEGIFNSALIMTRQGTLVDAYDKVHCQTHDMKYTAGGSLPVFGSDFGPFGVMICADRRWPETVRTLALKGARIILNPTYGMHDERNLHMMQTRSYESEVFIAFTHPRQALLTAPTGQVICNETRDDVPFVVSTVDLAEADGVRAGSSAHLRDRRPDVYAR